MKFKKCFFLPSFSKSPIKNNPSCNYAQFSRKKLKAWSGNGIKIVLFLSSFYPVHISFQYKLNSRKSLLIETVIYFVYCFNFFYILNEYGSVSSLLCRVLLSVKFQFKKEQANNNYLPSLIQN